MVKTRISDFLTFLLVFFHCLPVHFFRLGSWIITSSRTHSYISFCSKYYVFKHLSPSLIYIYIRIYT